MSPHRINGRGTLRIDRIIPDVGRIARASGTNDAKTYQAIVQKGGLLDVLRGLRRFDVLRDLRDGRLVALEVYERFRAGELDRLPLGKVNAPLRERVTTWLDTLENPETRAGYRKALRRAGALRAGIPIHELTDLLRAFRVECLGRGVFRIYNLARAAAQAFTRDELGARHVLHLDVEDLRPLKRVGKAKLPPAYSHADLNHRCRKLSTAAVAIARGMAYTGMLPKEYWGEWEALTDRIHIEGTKRVGRVRNVPRLTTIAKPTISRVTFRRALKKAAPDLSPKHFRNFFARWLDEAGIPTVRRECYMGHGVRSMADLYPRAEVDRYLVGDAERITAYLGLVTKDLLRIERAV